MNTTPPKLHRRSYWVWMNTDEHPADENTTAISVEVTYADQLRGELEMAKQGVNMGQAPMTAATVWVWCAMVRQGLYAEAFPRFKATDLAEMEPVLRADELPTPDETPDPT
jgi:hypothetical protein